MLPPLNGVEASSAVYIESSWAVVFGYPIVKPCLCVRQIVLKLRAHQQRVGAEESQASVSKELIDKLREEDLG